MRNNEKKYPTNLAEVATTDATENDQNNRETKRLFEIRCYYLTLSETMTILYKIGGLILKTPVFAYS